MLILLSFGANFTIHMYILVSYDVATSTPNGQKRLRRVARICINNGQRVQNSVFECKVDPAQFAALKHQLLQVIDLEADSIRFYLLGNNWKNRIEHFGTKEIHDIEGPLIL